MGYTLAIEKAAFPVAITLACRLGVRGVFRAGQVLMGKEVTPAYAYRIFAFRINSELHSFQRYAILSFHLS